MKDNIKRKYEKLTVSDKVLVSQLINTLTEKNEMASRLVAKITEVVKFAAETEPESEPETADAS